MTSTQSHTITHVFHPQEAETDTFQSFHTVTCDISTSSKLTTSYTPEDTARCKDVLNKHFIMYVKLLQIPTIICSEESACMDYW